MRGPTAAWVSLALVTAAGAADGRKCKGAVEYRGAPMHAPPSPESISGADRSFAGELDGALAAKLDADVDWVLKNTPAPAVTAAAGVPGKGSWSTSKGFATLDPKTPLPEGALFHWASVGKSFTAAVVLQMADEGKLRLDEPLSRWFPDFPNARAVTVDHLLTHTSGIYNYQSDPGHQAKKGYSDPDEMIRIAEKHGSLFCPGEQWAYCNTGYLLLGRMVEKLDGRPFHEVVRKRVLDRLGLKQTVAMAPRQAPAALAPGHIGDRPDDAFEPTVPYGAGNIGGPAGDLIRYWQGFLSGKLFKRERVPESFARLYPMHEPSLFYGRGVMLFEVPGENGTKRKWLGHAGGTQGLNSVVAYDVGTGVYVAVAVKVGPPRPQWR